MTKDKLVGWHHQFYGHEFEETLGIGDGQRGLVCHSPWGFKELDMTERLTLIHYWAYHLISCCYRLNVPEGWLVWGRR